MDKIRAHLICHTHWDREWYLTKEEFMTKLVRLVDSVLDAVEQDSNRVSFMLDGQLIAIEDYLEVKPQNRERLINAISKGRIFVGPWYILPDEMLISGESHIRNYLMGDKLAQALGGKMNVGYLPDSFGHPEQMPQILKGLSMNDIVFWRGTGNHMTSSEFYWQSPCAKQSVFGAHMPYGYGNTARLSADMEESFPRMQDMIDNLKALSTSNTVLLMNGSDHIVNQENITEVVQKLNSEFEKNGVGKEIVLSTMEDYLNELKQNLPLSLETYSGEIRFGDRSMLLGGTISTRMPLKQWNAKVQRNMERYLEPMISLGELCGFNGDFGGFQNYIWKRILENHPHDSICGCSIDEVHDEMITRFKCVSQLEQTLISDSVLAMVKKFSLKTCPEGAQIVCFEPTQDGLPTFAEVTVDFDPMLTKRVNFSKSIIDNYEDSILHPPIPDSVCVFDASGRQIKADLISAKKEYYMNLQDDTAPEVYRVNRCRIGLLLEGLPFGYSVLTAFKGTPGKEKKPVQSFAENEFYKVEFDSRAGAFTVTDKSSGRILEGVNRLVDLGDAGDEYTYSWPQRDKVYTSSTALACRSELVISDTVQQLIVKGRLMLPRKLTDDRLERSGELIENDITITVSVYPRVNRIDFDVLFDNRSQDHVLKAEFPVGCVVRKSQTSTAFSVTEHDTAIAIPETWMEYPSAGKLTHGFVDLNDGKYGISLACDGITEYEAVEGENETLVRLTLLRCVGWLSRPDLITRKGDGGWSLETPGGQCIGEQHFEYSIVYHSGGWREAGSYPIVERRLHPPYLQNITVPFGEFKPQAELCEFLSHLPSLVRISAFKPAEDSNGLILRMFSISDKTEKLSLQLPKSINRVFLCNLREDSLSPADFKAGVLRLEVDSAEIITVRLI